MNPMFYLLLALTAALAATANAAGVPVLDTDGKILNYWAIYYVLPRFPGAVGGGLTLAPRGDKKCPLYVGQEISEVNKGLPARLSNWRTSSPVVVESDYLEIKMDIKPTSCAHSTYWCVAEPENVTEPLYIAAGPESSIGFQIKKTEGSGYKIVFCPIMSNCTDVGIFVDRNGVRRLALTSTPFEVVFKRVTGTETSSKTYVYYLRQKK